MSEFCRVDHPAYVSLMEIRSKTTGHLSIYALVDPRDMTVRYIGKTCDPCARLLEHIESPHLNWALRAWLAELEASELIPEMAILQEVNSLEWEFAERSWIKLGRDLGSLYNVADGGMTRGKRKRLAGNRVKRAIKRAGIRAERRARVDPGPLPEFIEPPEIVRDREMQPRAPRAAKRAPAEPGPPPSPRGLWERLHCPMPGWVKKPKQAKKTSPTETR